jgi:uncharacterized membrane protein (DUF4010 family)
MDGDDIGGVHDTTEAAAVAAVAAAVVADIAEPDRLTVKESFSTLELTVLLLLVLLLPLMYHPEKYDPDGVDQVSTLMSPEVFDLLLAADMILTSSEVLPVLAQNSSHQHRLNRSHYTVTWSLRDINHEFH